MLLFIYQNILIIIMPTPEQSANTLESEIEKAISQKDLETMKKLLPEYEKYVLEITRGSIEQIAEFNFEAQLERFTSFYSSHNIDIPSDFESTLRDIWNKHQVEIKEAIEQQGFDEILFIPPYDTKDINDKTTADYVDTNGNKTETWQSENFKQGGSFEGLHDTRSGTRIVLTHKAENLNTPLLLATKNKSIYDLCNATTDQEKAHIDELINTKQPLPLEGLTFGEYLIADRLHFKETGQHLDYRSSWTWLPASYSGSRVVGSSWNPGFSRVHVFADVPGDRDGHLGFRASRVFS